MNKDDKEKLDAEQTQENRRALLQLYSDHTIQYGVAALTMILASIATRSGTLGIDPRISNAVVAALFVPAASAFISGVFYGSMAGLVVSLNIPEIKDADSLPKLNEHYDKETWKTFTTFKWLVELKMTKLSAPIAAVLGLVFFAVAIAIQYWGS